jgi:hypothetical protein
MYLKNEKQTLITDIVQKHPSLLVNSGVSNTKIELVPKIPVKSVNWFFRKTLFENESISRGPGFDNSTDNNKYYFHNRYNLSTQDTYSIINEFYNPPMSSAKIFVNGEDIPGFKDTDHKYYKYTVPLLSRLARPLRNIYTFAFSMNPINVEPSGSLDFSQLQSNRTVLDIKMVNGLTDDYNLHIYYVGYQTYTFENGYISRVY